MQEPILTPKGQDTQASNMETEVQNIFSNFLIPQFDKLKTSFPRRYEFTILVSIGPKCFVTNPGTTINAIPTCPDDLDISELWLKEVEYAKAMGLDAESIPTEGTPHRLRFTMNYTKE